MSGSSSRLSTPNPVTTAPLISHPAHTLLSRAHSPTTAANIFTDKIRNKPLLLQPSNYAQSFSDKRALRRHIRARKQAYHLRKQRPKPLSAKEKRATGVYDLKSRDGTSECSYSVYQGLNQLWTGYFWEIMGFVKDGSVVREKIMPGKDGLFRGISVQGQGSLLASMDFHGMEVEVVRCVDVGRVGLKGIVVRETKFTFVLVGPGDKVRTVLKKGAVFRVNVKLPSLDDEKSKEVGEVDEKGARVVVLELHGDQLEIRPVERAVKKFKWKIMDYL